FSYDEEVGCLGVRSMLAELEKRSNKPALCLIGEPTSLQPVLGHKGKLAMRCKVHGAACHSAYAPQGVNAIEYAAKLICHLGDIARDLAHPALHDDRFDPPYSTIQTGLIKGGEHSTLFPQSANSILRCAHCRGSIRRRFTPGWKAMQRMNYFHGCRRSARRPLLHLK